MGLGAGILDAGVNALFMDLYPVARRCSTASTCSSPSAP